MNPTQTPKTAKIMKSIVNPERCRFAVLVATPSTNPSGIFPRGGSQGRGHVVPRVPGATWPWRGAAASVLPWPGLASPWPGKTF